ncbi:MAG: dioxygenase [Acidocella sp. 20-57-95]|nr:MAG: dioxygenase [Acidocella sp. 20-57-95]OYV58931.1 MAG: dioxygenase [Acidocella sp. 21-58-7]HQT65265.1 class III extradiol ring-cleavage dioxygenase [Acidocella sp.]HQU05049.1 class III extradiol ring-cleavage dioxygenase [Acidocella sp.]
MQPVLFLSHGSPMTALMDTPARHFLAGLGAALAERPKAILVVSAHWESAAPMLNAVAENTTIHDFYGFPRALYQLHYNAPGAPGLARNIAEILQKAGFQAGVDEARGLDHGAWVPLLLAYPEAEIPVLQLSVQTHLGTAHHVRLGEALAPLRAQGVLILGSGSFTHDLRRFRGSEAIDAPETPDVTAFSDWMDEKIKAHDVPALVNYRSLAPHAVDEHPTEEHLLPLYVALGAAGPGAQTTRLHQSVEFGFLRMDSYAFS